MWLFLAFLAVPLIEIALFIQVGGLIGLWPTLGIVILTAILGAILVRTQGLMAMNDLRGSFSRLEDPSKPLAHGAMILFSGALLLTPGFFTDAIGFALLMPPVRNAIYKNLRSRVSVQTFEMGSAPHRTQQDSSVIETEYHEVETKESSSPGHSGWTKH